MQHHVRPEKVESEDYVIVLFASLRMNVGVKFCILTEGPIAILDVFTKLPESILDTLIVKCETCIS